MRGSADSPPKLPTPPSERGAPTAPGLGMFGGDTTPSPLEAFASTAIEEEKYARARGLPSIAALLGPLSPESLSVTPPHPLSN